MNKYNEHVKESIDYFNHESECMKHRVCNCDMQTSLRIGREKNCLRSSSRVFEEAYSTATS